MKQYLIITFILFYFFSYGQNIKNKYSSMNNELGNIYFIHEQKGFECKELKNNKTLNYDITYSSIKDSITLNFTYYNEIAFPIDSVKLYTHTGEFIKTKSSKIHVEPEKKIWKHRASFLIPVTTASQIFGSQHPFDIILYSKEKSFIYKMNKNNWDKNTYVVNKVFEIIQYSQNN